MSAPVDSDQNLSKTLCYVRYLNAALACEAEMKLWIGNIAPGTTDDELRDFVRKYAPDLEIKSIQRVEGDGSRPAASMEFVDTPYGSVEKISMRLHGMYWKGRELFVQTVSR